MQIGSEASGTCVKIPGRAIHLQVAGAGEEQVVRRGEHALPPGGLNGDEIGGLVVGPCMWSFIGECYTQYSFRTPGWGRSSHVLHGATCTHCLSLSLSLVSHSLTHSLTALSLYSDMRNIVSKAWVGVRLPGVRTLLMVVGYR